MKTQRMFSQATPSKLPIGGSEQSKAQLSEEHQIRSLDGLFQALGLNEENKFQIDGKVFQINQDLKNFLLN